MNGSSVEIIGFAQDERCLLHGPTSLREAPLIDGKFMTSSIDRLTQPLHAQVGQFLGDCLETLANVVEFSCHGHLRTGVAPDVPDDSCSV